jgi:ABC-type histidine transport system ATPase subunit
VIENVIDAPMRVLGMPRKQAVDEAETLLARVGLAVKSHSYPAKAWCTAS